MHERGLALRNIRAKSVVIMSENPPRAALGDFSRSTNLFHPRGGHPYPTDDYSRFRHSSVVQSDIRDLGTVFAAMISPEYAASQPLEPKWLEIMEKISIKCINHQIGIAAATACEMIQFPQDNKILENVLNFFGQYDSRTKAWLRTSPPMPPSMITKTPATET